MFLNSLGYLLFLPLVFVGFYLARSGLRWLVILAASVGFYAALKEPSLLVALSVVTLATFFSGIGIERWRGAGTGKSLFWGGVAVNLLVLIVMRYMSTATKVPESGLSGSSWLPSFGGSGALSSIGVSYYVLQAISYLIDVYIDIVKPERHLGYFALHLSFFPKLLQGPIERSGDLIPQLRAPSRFDYDNFRRGAMMFAAGLYKKAVLADRLALYVNPIYDNARDNSGIVFIIATYMYALQIYFDFSGYTDMARGSARLFNIDLTGNFNSPYAARSIAEFWRRWHISFSRWILDYIFMPLQMQFRKWKAAGTPLALVITFLVSGLWHGATPCFVIWGLLHGIYLGASVLYKPFQARFHRRLGLGKKALTAVQTIVTFHLVCFAWIFFRANSLSDALHVTRTMFSGIKGSRWLLLSKGYTALVVLALSFAVMIVVGLLNRRGDAYHYLFSRPAWIRWAVYCNVALAIVLFGVFGHSKFIYARF